MRVEPLLDFWVTDADEVFMAFVAKASTRYERIRLTLKPLQEAVDELSPNWQPKEQSSWQTLLGHLLTFREAVAACVALLKKEQTSRAHPIPRTFAVNSLGFRTRSGGWRAKSKRRASCSPVTAPCPLL